MGGGGEDDAGGGSRCSSASRSSSRSGLMAAPPTPGEIHLDTWDLSHQGRVHSVERRRPPSNQNIILVSPRGSKSTRRSSITTRVREVATRFHGLGLPRTPEKPDLAWCNPLQRTPASTSTRCLWKCLQAFDFLFFVWEGGHTWPDALNGWPDPARVWVGTTHLGTAHSSLATVRAGPSWPTTQGVSPSMARWPFVPC